MRDITLGRTGITVPQNAFGALPIQRISTEDAVKLMRKAYDGDSSIPREHIPTVKRRSVSLSKA